VPGRALSIVLAEDSVLLREGVIGILEAAGHRVVAAVGDAEALVAAVTEVAPELVITDVRMPPGHSDEGLRAASVLRAAQPGLGILVLSQYIADAYLPALLAAPGPGGIGYLLKDRVGQVSEFLQALQAIAAGGTVIDPEVVRQLLARRRQDAPLEALSQREREVLALMAEGHTNGRIARTMFISEATVRKHVGNIFAKLDLDQGGDRRVLAVLTYLRGQP
jgi:DNA-binding NarL/FixJ family response regulator